MKNEMSTSLKSQRILSVVTLVIGISLMAYMIKVEEEPGALPLLLLIIGIIWGLIIQLKINKHKK